MNNKITSLTRTPKNRVYCLSPGTPNISLYLQSPNMLYEDIIFHGGGYVGGRILTRAIFFMTLKRTKHVFIGFSRKTKFIITMNAFKYFIKYKIFEFYKKRGNFRRFPTNPFSGMK